MLENIALPQKQLLRTQAKLGELSLRNPRRPVTDVFGFLRSEANLRCALAHVEHRSPDAAGVDGRRLVNLSTREKDELVHGLGSDLKHSRYQPCPLREVRVEKADGGTRVIVVPTVRDRVAQRAAHHVLLPIMAARWSPSSYCRSELGVLRAVWDTAEMFVEGGATGFLKTDILGCYDHIDHALITNDLRKAVSDTRVQRLVDSIIKAPIASAAGPSAPRSKGLPPGGNLSPLLCEVYLMPLDRHLAAPRGQAQADGAYRYIRYVDDLVVLSGRRRDDITVIHDDLVRWLKSNRRLSLAETKTQVGTPEDGLTILGFHLRRENGVCVVRPSDRSIARIKARLLDVAMAHKGDDLGRQKRLQAIWSGWIRYFGVLTSPRRDIRLDQEPLRVVGTYVSGLM